MSPYRFVWNITVLKASIVHFPLICLLKLKSRWINDHPGPIFQSTESKLHKLESCPDSEASAAGFTRKKTDLLNAAQFLFSLSFLLS